MSSTMEDALDLVGDDIDIVGTRKRFNDAVGAAKQNGKTLPKIATEAGVGYSSLHAWANGKYEGDNVGLALKAAAWMVKQQAKARTQSTVRNPPTFMMTRTSSEILELLEYAQMAPDMVVGSGAPGIGKTTTINHYKAKGSNVWIATAEPAIKSIGALLDMLAEAMGAEFGHGGATMSRNIRRRLTGSQGLLIVDEVQHLTPSLRDQLRSTVYDGAGIGVALIGNEQLNEQFARERGTGQYAQLISRIGERLNRPRPYKADAELLLDGWMIQGAEAREKALGIALKPGGLREMNKTLRRAYSLSDLRGADEPSAEDITAAYLRRGGNA